MGLTRMQIFLYLDRMEARNALAHPEAASEPEVKKVQPKNLAELKASFGLK